MGLGDDILTILFSYSAGYKRMRQVLFSPTYPRKHPRLVLNNSNVLYTTLSRLKKEELVTKENNVWGITRKGKEYFQEKLHSALPRHFRFDKSQKPDRKKNMIIVFDIPEKYRRKRDWLRVELALLGFKPLQKSVWLGPTPLPREFIKNLHELNTLQYLKFFKAAEENIV